MARNRPVSQADRGEVEIWKRWQAFPKRDFSPRGKALEGAVWGSQYKRRPPRSTNGTNNCHVKLHENGLPRNCSAFRKDYTTFITFFLFFPCTALARLSAAWYMIQIILELDLAS